MNRFVWECLSRYPSWQLRLEGSSPIPAMLLSTGQCVLTLLSSHVRVERTPAFLCATLEGVLGEWKPHLPSHPLTCVYHTGEWPSCRGSPHPSFGCFLFLSASRPGLSVTRHISTSPSPHLASEGGDGSHQSMQRTCSYCMACAASPPPPPHPLFPTLSPCASSTAFSSVLGARGRKEQERGQCPQMA